MASSPRIIRRIAMSDTQLRRESPISRFIVAPRAQASRRCETQATLSGQAAKLCYRFGPLTPSARSANLIAGDGTKNGFPSSEQRTGKNQKRPLDRKSPIQVRIHLPPAGSPVRTLTFGGYLLTSGAERGLLSRQAR